MKSPRYQEFLFASLLLIFALGFYSVVALTERFVPAPSSYQVRDMMRSIEIYFQHRMIWSGPDMSGGGQLPGPFFYWLIGLPYLFFQTIESVLYFEYALAALGLAVICYVLKQKYSPITAALFFLLFLNSPYFNFQLYMFWNPSFIFLFVAVITALLVKNPSVWRQCAAAFAIGLAIQIHFSVIMLIIPLVLSVFFANSNYKKKIKSLGLIAAAFLLPLVPFLIWKLSHSETLPAYESFGKGLSRFFVRIPFLFLHPTYVHMERTAKWFFAILTAEVYLLPAIAAFFYYRHSIRKSNLFLYFATVTSIAALLIILIGLGQPRYSINAMWVMAIVASVLLPQILRPVRNYYAFLFFVASVLGYSLAYRIKDPIELKNFFSPAGIIFAFAAGLLLRYYFVNKSDRKILSVFCGITYVTLCFPALISENSIYNEGRNINATTAKKLAGEIASTTRWDYTYFRQHTVMTGIYAATQLSMYYEKALKSSADQKKKSYDGLLVSSLPNADFADFFGGFPLEIMASLKNKEIVCVLSVRLDTLELCYYNFTDRQKIRRLSNIGYIYMANYKPEFEITQLAGVRPISPTAAAFYFNPCETHEDSCAVVFSAELKNSLLHLSVFGDPLGVFNPAQNAAFGWRIEEPKLRVRCGSKDTLILIASAIGGADNGWQRDGLLAPFDGFYALPCEKPASVTLVIEKSRLILPTGYLSEDYSQAPQFEIAWPL